MAVDLKCCRTFTYCHCKKTSVAGFVQLNLIASLENMNFVDNSVEYTIHSGNFNKILRTLAGDDSTWLVQYYRKRIVSLAPEPQP